MHRCKWSSFSSFPASISNCPPRFEFLYIVISYAPQTHTDPYQSCSESHPIRGIIAESSIRTLSPSIRENDGMGIVDPSFWKFDQSSGIALLWRSSKHTIKQIENVTEYNRRQRHAAPILTKTVHAKTLCHKGGIHPEEKSIRH